MIIVTLWVGSTLWSEATEATIDIHYAHSLCTFIMLIHYAHSLWTSTLYNNYQLFIIISIQLFVYIWSSNWGHYWHSLSTFIMYIHYAHSLCTFIMHIHYAHSLCTCIMHIYYAHSFWTSTLYNNYQLFIIISIQLFVYI